MCMRKKIEKLKVMFAIDGYDDFQGVLSDVWRKYVKDVVRSMIDVAVFIDVLNRRYVNGKEMGVDKK